MNFSQNHLLSLHTLSVIFPVWICFYFSFYPVSLSTINLSFSTFRVSNKFMSYVAIPSELNIFPRWKFVMTQESIKIKI